MPQNAIQSKILVFRGKNVILDRDLALLYEVKPIALRQQVKRNIERFPDDFMFQLTKKEAGFLVSQNVIPSKQSLGGYLPYAFTENGVAMLSSVLKSKKAINVNIQIMRAFTKMREMLVNYQELKQRIESMERKVDEKSKVNSILFEEVFKEIEAVKRLLSPPEPIQKEEIGFKGGGKK
ncbi:MAG: ORF6N domain-containing protein [bacterium]